MHDKFDAKPKVKKNILPENPEENLEKGAVKVGRFPSWLHRPLPKGSNIQKTTHLIDKNRLFTVCEEAKCPNLLECFSNKTATFLTMGKDCTRNCGFCDIDHLKHPPALDPKEPENIVDAAKKLGLQHIVLTMVARDDLEDGGAAHLAAIIRAIKADNSINTVEVLTSDLKGDPQALDTIIAAKPEIFNHNIETIQRLTPRVRHIATYERTLTVLRYVKMHSEKMHVKSGLMVGLGESKEEVFETIQDLKDAGVDIITIGQYLQPNPRKLRVKKFVTPEEFKEYETFGYSIGVKHIYSGPFVRSSYNAGLVQRKVSEKDALNA